MPLPIRSEEDLVPRIHVFRKDAKVFDISTAMCLGNRTKLHDTPCFDVYDAGGGFVKFVPVARLLSHYLLAEASDLSPKYRKARFILGEDNGLITVDGYTDGRRWNGWACPMFSEDQFAKIRRHLWTSSLIDEEASPSIEFIDGKCFYDPAVDPKHAIWITTDGLLRIPREEITAGPQTFVVFNCSDMGFTWEEVTDADDEAEAGDGGRASSDVHDPPEGEASEG